MIFAAACDVRTGASISPRRGVQPVADRDPHQVVIRRVKVHVVDAMPVPVVGVQHRWILVRLPTELFRVNDPARVPSSCSSSPPTPRPHARAPRPATSPANTL